ncbi:MAG: CPBP family intramembrane metalloprotease [Verrucomicrobia bacterium]|nr:CPBP family intramembrane metalloprotease [bacterium]NDD56200.1 CPBP family intramembrane metalloprotease [Verrucomicrobiota bacterium]
MFSPVPTSTFLLLYVALIFGSSLFFLFAGGWRRLRQLLQPAPLPENRSLNFGPGPMTAAVVLLASASLMAPALLPGAGLAAGLLLASLAGSHPFVFWGLRRELRDLGDSLRLLLTLLWPILLLLLLSSGLYLALGLPLKPQPALLKFLEARDLGEILPFLAYAWVIAPIWEEIFFRGTLFPWLAGRMPVTQAQWLSALAFGAVHLHGPTMIPLTVFGALLAGIYRTTGSLVPAMLVHSLFNANTCILLLLARSTPP